MNRDISLRGGGGRGRGRGRGGGKQRQNELPSSLHAVLERGTATRETSYQVWTERESVLTNIEPQLLAYRPHGHPTILEWSKTKLLPPGLRIDLSPLHYFQLMFPMGYLQKIVDSTNIHIIRLNSGEQITKKEFFAFLVIRLTLALCPRSTGDGYNCFWQKPKDDVNPSVLDSTELYGKRFGMGLSRFKFINESFRLDEFQDSGEIDPYKPIRAFIEAFNKRREECITPGFQIIVDECMSQWKGLESVISDETLIHTTKIARKPKGVGMEMKCSADGATSIMLHLELQEGKKADKKEFETGNNPIPSHCAVTLRCVKPWFGSNRLVVADAAFSSLRTCTELAKKGLYFTGVIKGATKGFPLQFRKDFEDSSPKRADFKVITTSINDGRMEREIFAVLYCLKKNTIRNIISSFSNTTPGEPQRVYRSKRVILEEDGFAMTTTEIREIPRPKVMELGMKYFGAINLNDRFRQGYLKIEESWPTKRAWVRSFTTIFGIICTDSYLAYRHDKENEIDDSQGKLLTYKEFLGQLAYQLIFNDLFRAVPISSRVRSRHPTTSSSSDKVLPVQGALKDLEEIKRKYRDNIKLSQEEKQRRLGNYQKECSICKLKTSRCCITCSQEREIIHAVCDQSMRPGCWNAHLHDFHDL